MNIITHKEILSWVKPYVSSSPIIVEVGAFTGHDTIRMAEQFPTGTIHAFEPVPELYEQLTQSTHYYNNIKTYPYALSNKNGINTLYQAEKTSGKITQASSLQKPKDRLRHSLITFPTEINVPTITLPTWCTQNTITEIDLLWLDTQGHEFIILESSVSLLAHIKTIYTEVGFIEAYEEQKHATEIIQWLRQHNFVPIAKDYTNPPQWFFGNILFVRTDILNQ